MRKFGKTRENEGLELINPCLIRMLKRKTYFLSTTGNENLSFCRDLLRLGDDFSHFSLTIADVQAHCISKLVKVAGITIAASRVKAKATYVIVMCKNCKNVQRVPCRPGLGGAIVPRSCNHIPQVYYPCLFVPAFLVFFGFWFCIVFFSSLKFNKRVGIFLAWRRTLSP